MPTSIPNVFRSLRSAYLIRHWLSCIGTGPVPTLLALTICLLLFRPARAQQPDARWPEHPDLAGISRGASSLGDVNGDGHLDLVLAGSGDDAPKAVVYLGDGQGGFADANAGLTGVKFGASCDLGDVDGDGNLDLVVTGDAGTAEEPNRTTTLYLGDGEGGFTTADAGLPGVRHSTATFAQIDGDGHLDLFIMGDDVSDGTATVYLGDGEGGFTEANAGLPPTSFGSVSIGDVNGDGNQDLLVTGQDEYRNPTTTLYLGDGTGQFTNAEAGLTGVMQGSSSLGDVNGDGHLDAVIMGRNERYRGTTLLYLGDGTGQFADADAGLPQLYHGSTSLGDADGDQHLDLVITGLDSRKQSKAMLYLGDGQGSFTKSEVELIDLAWSSVSLGDVNGDGHLDLFITGSFGNRSRAALYLGDGDGGFTAVEQ